METQKQCQVNLPLEPFENLACEVSCVLWPVCSASVGSLRLSWFIFAKQVSALRAECAEEATLLCTVLLLVLDEWWEIFSLAFRWDLNVESTLFNTSWCLEGFKFLSLDLKRVVDIFFPGWTVLLPRFVRGPVRGCWFSLVTLELLGWEKLNGTGLVHWFFFLVFPCSK